jgi:hypothetical protein
LTQIAFTGGYDQNFNSADERIGLRAKLLGEGQHFHQRLCNEQPNPPDFVILQSVIVLDLPEEVVATITFGTSQGPTQPLNRQLHPFQPTPFSSPVA